AHLYYLINLLKSGLSFVSSEAHILAPADSLSRSFFSFSIIFMPIRALIQQPINSLKTIQKQMLNYCEPILVTAPLRASTSIEEANSTETEI
ncbi:hypothetical protein, partial [Nitrincola alkalilacustris]|uniref:hypothetical protein n=1 Tax=Nitrincola alkalilacustris TaxID=1571224 RepID=UPI00197D9E5B